MDKKTARDFYTLKTTEYPATIFARVDDGDRNKNTCMQCDNPLESKNLLISTDKLNNACRSIIQNSCIFSTKEKIRSPRYPI